MNDAETVSIFKAQPTSFSRPQIPSLTVAFTETLPRDGGGSEMIMDMDAEALEEALHRVLPGGTYDRLRLRMMIRGVSQLVVRHPLVAPNTIPSQSMLPGMEER